ncbi:hypothetical protein YASMINEVIRUS_367 [Yasminevirus sp. GU-2018]|uniref:Uncharacterized protein n=1 Tax=Yasminevirus sp. GU-2018 TaxID=2420051 RepID=A0A5K0U8V2_9VIRU|nr:hypothetical protein YASMINEVIRUS_367 [Yasminevirus sp. GU-2018]
MESRDKIEKMDLFTALHSKSARLTSWKDVYDVYVKFIDASNVQEKITVEPKKTTKGVKSKKVEKTDKIDKPEAQDLERTDWYEKCMNDTIKKMLLPTLTKRSGTNLTFEVKKLNETYFKDNIQNYLRMVVMCTLYNVTCDSQQNMYVSHYDHDTDLVTAYPIEALLMASFYGVKIRGILFIKSLNNIVLAKGYSTPIADQNAKRAMIKIVDYEDLFGFPYDDDDDDEYKEYSDDEDTKKTGSRLRRSAKVESVRHADYDDESDDSTDSKKPSYKKTNVSKTKKQQKTIDDLHYYPCCVYRVNISGKIVEKCTDATAEGAHHCFGCGTDFVKKVSRDNVPIHSQMFDFNKFVTNIKQDGENEYVVEFDENQNAPYKHASYSDMGRANVLVNVKESVSKLSWVTSMRIKIVPKNDVYVLNVKHVGIDCF